MKNIIIIILLLAASVANAQSTDRVKLIYPLTVLPANDHQVPELVSLNTGVQLEYVEQGDINATPVIFLHGLSDSWRSFEQVLACLPRSVHAIAISQRGHGDSEKPLATYDSRDFAADIAAFVKQKKWDAVVVVGHAMGGLNAIRFAIDYPQLTRAVFIVGTNVGWNNNALMMEGYRGLLHTNEHLHWEFVAEYLKATMAKHSNDPYFRSLIEEATKTPRYVVSAVLEGITNEDLSSQLHRVEKPVVILWGAKDRFINRKDQVFLVENLCNSRLIIYENSGHALHWEEPARFAADIENYIQHLPKH